jgi:putative FmdB family regulatory protein
MKSYEYACHECSVSWEQEFEFGKPDDTMKCPECGKDCGQNWLGRTAPAIHFKGSGWTGQNESTGYNKQGGSDEVNLKLQEQSKDRMDGGWKHYARYTPPEKLTKGARKLSSTELKDRLDHSKKMTQINYDKSGQSPHKKQRPSNI